LRLVDSQLPVPLEGREDLELWLIEPDDAANPIDLVSLGLVDPNDPGVFEIPTDYDPSTFSVVDISVEPRDGEPTHSGRSILRGPLEVT
jgi:anti-sigma-K factor RskA